MKSSSLLYTLLVVFSFKGACHLASDESVRQPELEEAGNDTSEGLSILKSSHQPQENELYQLPLILPITPALEVEKICNPILDWRPAVNNYTSSASEDARPQSALHKLEADKVNLTFAIPDIDMPVAPAGGSLNSAIKLMSAFDNPFGSDGGDEPQPVESVVQFRENQLNILGLNLSMLNVHLYPNDDPKFGIGVTIKNTILTGRFSYDGPLLLTDSRLGGYYRMSIDNIYLVVASNLTRLPDHKKSNSSKSAESGYKIQSKLASNDFKLNITNLGYINIEVFDSKDSGKPTTNYLLRLLQRVLQRTIKRTYYSFENYIRETLQKEGREFLDCELTRFNRLIDHEKFATPLSDLEGIIGAEIARSQLSSVPLPNYEHQQNILGSTATVNFYNGSLSGLNNTKLNGETRIKLQDEHLFINTSIGWSDLRPQFSWSLTLGNNPKTSSPISKGLVSFTIKVIKFDAVITKGLRPHTRLVVDQLTIKQLDSPKMDISGLPGMNRLTRGMVNFFMGRLKQRISSSIQPALKQQLERSLNKMNLFR